MKKLIFLTIIILAIFIRLPNLDAVFQGDESYFPELVEYQLENGFSLTHETPRGVEYWEDLPLTGLIYIIYSFIVGFSTVKLRLLSLLIGIINLTLVFFLAKRIFNEKTAFFSLFLMAFSYWHIFESFMVERDGSFMMLIYIAVFFCYYVYLERKNLVYLFPISILILLSLFIKSSGILIVIMLAILFLKDNNFFSILKTRRWLLSKERTKLLLEAVFLIVPICLYLVSLLFIYNWNFELFNGLYSHAVPVSILSLSFFSIIRILVYLILWGSPLIIGLAVLSALKYEDKKLPLLIWIIIPVIAYSFSVYAGSVDRYLSIIIPALCILAGKFLSEIKIKKKFLLAATVIFLLLFHLLSLIKLDYLNHNIKKYIINFISLKWNFIFPFYGAGQPTFMMSFIVIGSVLVLSALLFLLYLIKTKRNIILPLFLALTLAFSFFVIEENNWHPFFPNFKEVVKDISQNKENFPLPIITSHEWLRFYLDLDYKDIIMVKDRNKIDNKNLEKIKTNGGTIILVHYPNYKFGFLKQLQKCSLNKIIKNKNIDMASIYICPTV